MFTLKDNKEPSIISSLNDKENDSVFTLVCPGKIDPILTTESYISTKELFIEMVALPFSIASVPIFSNSTNISIASPGLGSEL